jgi:LysR family malonate utilization transcriptional regulator
MLPRIDEEITFRKLEILLAFMESGNLARAAERARRQHGQRPPGAAFARRRAPGARCSGSKGATCSRTTPRMRWPSGAGGAAHDVRGIRSTREMAGYAADRIRIGSLYSLTSGTVPALIMGLKLRKPDIHTELVLGSNDDLLRKLRDGVIDASLMGLPEGAPTRVAAAVRGRHLLRRPAGSRHAEQREIDLGACADERFVSLSEGFVTYSGFIEAFRIAGSRPTW